MPLLIRDALQDARQLGVARLDAQLLLAHVLTTVDASPSMAPAITRSWLLAHDEQALTPGQRQCWQAKLGRRAEGEPLAYVTGEQTFCGLQLQVTPAVLIPRPETEELVHWALECLSLQASPAPHVLDLGTGSGAVALAIKHRCPSAQVHATDISPAALQVAMANAQRLRLDVGFGLGNWWAAAGSPAGSPAKTGSEEALPVPVPVPVPLPLPLPLLLPLPLSRFNLVVSNPPYIAPGDEHLPALQHEPTTALVGADDGLGDLRRIIEGSRGRLAAGAWLLLEHGHDQAAALQQLLLQAGYTEPRTRADLAGLPRCTGARWP